MRRLILFSFVLVLVSAPPALADTEIEQTSAVPARVIDANLTQLNSATVRCWSKPFWAQRVRRSAAGVKLWGYRLTIDKFCWTGTKIVLAQSHRSVQGPFVPFWDFVAHLDSTITWNGKWSRRHFVEGKFTWMGPVGLVTKTPSVWITLRGDGFHSWDTEA